MGGQRGMDETWGPTVRTVFRVPGKNTERHAPKQLVKRKKKEESFAYRGRREVDNRRRECVCRLFFYCVLY